MGPTASLEMPVPLLPLSLLHACHMSWHVWYCFIPLYNLYSYIWGIYSCIWVGSLTLVCELVMFQT